jgi:hypothetical protein
MDLNVGDILAEIARELHLNGSPIVLQWNTVSSGTLPEPVDGTVPASALVPQTMTLPAFVHQVQATGVSSVRQFNEVEVGDLILDFEGNAPIPEAGVEHRPGDRRSEVRDLVFVVPLPGSSPERPQFKAYVAKEISEKLAQSWDATVQGRQLMRSVLVRVKT